MEDIKKVALLIDMDNISDKHAEQIYKHAAAKGNVTVRRGYGVMKNFPWNSAAMSQYAIEPVARVVYVPKKNVTDIALVIDALGLAYQKIVDVICIASNDSDFSLLAMKIRELGIEVYGVGADSAQQSFVSSCDGFLRLPSEPPKPKDSEKAEEKSVIANKAAAEKQKANKIKGILKDAYGHCENESGWALIASMGQYIKRIYPDFSPKDYGYKRFSDLVKAETEKIFVYDESETSAHKIRIKENSN